MRVCPSCGHENADDVDFCANCGQYVRWEPTRLAPSVKPAEQAAVAAPEAPPVPPTAPAAGDGAAVQQPAPGAPVQQAAPPAQNAAAPPPPPGAPPAQPPAPPAEAPPPPVPPDSIVLALRLPGQESSTGEAVTANVEAGGHATVLVLVRNQSGIVDNYDLGVQGIPEHWWTANPGTVYLIPYGTSEEGFEQEVEIHLHPPRAPESEARPWPVAVTAESRAHGVEVGRANATLDVAPYQEIESEMRPERKAGRRRARFAIAVRNKANAPVNVEVAAVDAANQTRFEIEHPQFPTRPGRRAGTIFWAKPLKQIWIGRKVEHRFTLDAKTVGYDAVATPKMGVFVQKPWLPWWLLLLLPLLIAAAILLYLLWPRTTVVPNVRTCGSITCAEQLLDAKGLKLGEVREVKTARRKPGSPIGSTPPTGKEVDKGTVVNVRIAVAVGAAKIAVPSVVGMTLQEADAALKKAKLQRGQLQPTPDSPTAKVTGQVPKEGELADEGTAVDLFFAKPAEEKPKQTTTAGGGEKPGGAGGAGGGGTGGGGAGQQAGTTLATFLIVFDNGRDIIQMPSQTGKPIKKLVASKEVEEEASLSPDGKLVAYRRGARDKGQIFVVDPTKPQFAHAVTNEGFNDGRPTFSPDGKVIAFIRTPAPDPTTKLEDTDLCFVPTSASAAKPRCIADPATIVARPAWSPTGRSIVVLSRPNATDAKQVELEQYTSPKPSSGNPADWNSQGLITDKMHGERFGDQVVSAGWSADGKRFAISANWASSAFHLVLAKSEEDAISEPQSLTRIRSCELAWAPEGYALAIVQRDNNCRQAGGIARIDPDKPTELVPLTNAKLGAENPVWARKSG